MRRPSLSSALLTVIEQLEESHERLIYMSGVCFASGCAASRQGSHTLNLRGFRHAAVEGAEHQVLLT
ncbi:MAG: hypothetical protein WCB44_19210, partial [Stellaceae bacterium]